MVIIPEIDAPAHTLAFSHYDPELGSKEYGMDHLDLFNPKTYEFMDALFKEYLEGDDPVFVGPKVHIGTDEYSNKDQAVVEKAIDEALQGLEELGSLDSFGTLDLGELESAEAFTLDGSSDELDTFEEEQ